MTKILYLKSDYEGVIKDVKVKDGKIDIEDKQFDTANAIPILLQSDKPLNKSVVPLYILKHDTIEPSINIHKRRIVKKDRNGDIISVTPEFVNKGMITPELQKKMIGMKILGNMIKMKVDSEFGGKRLITYGIAGIAAVFIFLYMNGVISF